MFNFLARLYALDSSTALGVHFFSMLFVCFSPVSQAMKVDPPPPPPRERAVIQPLLRPILQSLAELVIPFAFLAGIAPRFLMEGNFWQDETFHWSPPKKPRVRVFTLTVLALSFSHNRSAAIIKNFDVQYYSELSLHAKITVWTCSRVFCCCAVEQAVNRVPIFSPLSLEQKRLVSSALLEVHFRPGLYICEEVSFAATHMRYRTGTCAAIRFAMVLAKQTLQYKYHVG